MGWEKGRVGDGKWGIYRGRRIRKKEKRQWGRGGKGEEETGEEETGEEETGEEDRSKRNVSECKLT